MENLQNTLKDKKLFILDMDGTIYYKGNMFPETKPFLKKLQETNKQYLFLTNDSSKTNDEYKNNLQKLGIDSPNVFSSGDATLQFLLKYHKNKKIYLLAEEKVEKVYADSGLNLVQENGDIVVMTFDQHITYEKMNNVYKHVLRGIPYYASQPDKLCPVSPGVYKVDVGCYIAFIKTATDRTPEIIGKPSSTIYQMALDKYNIKAEDTVFIGDRLYTDIKGANEAGITSILTLTGESQVCDIETTKITPNFVINNLEDVTSVL